MITRSVIRDVVRPSKRPVKPLYGGLTLPRAGLLCWIRSANSDNVLDDEGTVIDESLADVGFALPISCYAAVGGTGFWFSDATTPITRTATQILALSSINQYHILFTPAKGLAVYDPYTTAQADIDKAHAFYRVSIYADDVPTAFFNGFDFTASGATYTGGPTYSVDNLGALVTPGTNKPSIQGARLATTLAQGAVLGPELCYDPGFNNPKLWDIYASGGVVGGGVATLNQSSSGLIYSGLLTVGKRYLVSFTILSQSTGYTYAQIGSGQMGPRKNDTGLYSFEANALGHKISFGGSYSDAVIDDISVREVIPTYYDTAADGTPLVSSKTQKTRTGSADFSTFTSAETYKRYAIDNPKLLPGWLCEPARTNYHLYSNDLTNAYYIATNVSVLGGYDGSKGSGTGFKITASPGNTDHFLPTGGAIPVVSTVCASYFVKYGSHRYVQISVYNRSSLYANFDILNGTIGTNSECTSGMIALGAGFIIYVVYTSKGTSETPYIVLSSSLSSTRRPVWNAVGTEYIYASDAQIEIGSFQTSRIPTTTASATRAATVYSCPTAGKIRANNTAIRKLIVPRATGQSGVHIYGTYTDANNYTALLMSPTSLTLRKRVEGVDTDATVSITHEAGVPLEIIGVRSIAYGMQLAARAYSGGAWGAWINGAAVTTAAAKADAVIASTYQLGALNSADQMTGNISLFDTLLLPDGIPDPLKYAKAKWGLPA